MKKLIFPILLLLAVYACDNGNDYLVDGGISSPNVETSPMEFFRSHSQLDTLALIIERAGMESAVNGETTIFAPNNLSIKNYVNKVLSDMRKSDPLAVYTVNDIPLDTLTKYLGGYIYPGKLRRENMVKEQGKIYTAVNGEEHRISLEPSCEYSSQLDDNAEYVFFTYKIGDEWDDWDNIDDDKKFVVRTSNLESTNGMIHVLQGGHILFNYTTD